MFLLRTCPSTPVCPQEEPLGPLACFSFFYYYFSFLDLLFFIAICSRGPRDTFLNAADFCLHPCLTQGMLVTGRDSLGLGSGLRTAPGLQGPWPQKLRCGFFKGNCDHVTLVFQSLCCSS